METIPVHLQQTAALLPKWLFFFSYKQPNENYAEQKDEGGEGG